MSDSHPALDALFGKASDAPEDDSQPSAADPTATASDASADEEVISIDEALAALDGEAAPPETALETEAPTDPETPNLDAEQYAAMVRELEEYRAQKAAAEVQTAEQQFIQPWANQQAVNDAYFDAEIERIERIGQERQLSQDEIDLAIYRRVELGQGFGIQRRNPQTGQMEVLGRIQTEKEFEDNLRRAQVEFVRSRTMPSAFEQLATKHNLDADDRRTLAQFQNYPPAELDKIMQALAAKNQRTTATVHEVVQTARRNVGENLSRIAAPGVPGAAPKPKVIATPRNAQEARQTTEWAARKMGLWSGTG
jgi:hypothetical protein